MVLLALSEEVDEVEVDEVTLGFACGLAAAVLSVTEFPHDTPEEIQKLFADDPQDLLERADQAASRLESR